MLEFVTNTNSLTVPEGATADFNVKLNAQPSGNVNVLVSHVSGDSDITINSSSNLTFTTSNWNTYQTVTLAASEDADTTNGTATIRLSASSIPNKDITATEIDNDIGGSPIIDLISPSTGPIGIQVTIAGSNFGASQGSGYVNFYDGVDATEIASWTDTQIICTVPEGAQTGCVTVTTDEGTSNCSVFTIRPGGVMPWLLLLLSDNDNPAFDILYQSDFSSDPGWITNNPASYYWDSDTQSYYGLQHRKAVEHAYHLIDWDNNTPLKVQVDLMQVSGGWAYWVNFCIMDSSMILPCGPSLGENIIHIGTGRDELGKHFILTCRESDGTAHSDRVNTSFEYGKYYRWDIQYLPDSSEVIATVRDIGDGTIMAELNIPAPTGFTGIDRIGFSTNIPGSGYDSTAPSYIDNIIVWGTSSD